MRRSMAAWTVLAVMAFVGRLGLAHEHPKEHPAASEKKDAQAEPAKGAEHPKGQEHPAGHEHPKKAAEAEPEAAAFTGEVLDMACYMAHEGKGKEHAKCAKKCLLEGGPAGLLLGDGSVLLLVEDHDNQEAFGPVGDLGGQKAVVTGRLRKRGGLSAVLVEKAEKAEEDEKTKD